MSSTHFLGTEGGGGVFAQDRLNAFALGAAATYSDSNYKDSFVLNVATYKMLTIQLITWSIEL